MTDDPTNNLGPLADWLDQSTWELTDPFDATAFDGSILKGQREYDTTKGEGTGFETDPFDWSLGSAFDTGAALALPAAAAAVDKQRPQDEIETLREEIKQYGCSIFVVYIGSQLQTPRTCPRPRCSVR